jgi:hypothetical protein
MAASVAYVTWDDDGRPHQAGGGGRRRGPRTLSRFEGYYLDPVYTPDGSKLVYLAGAAADQLYAIMMNIQPEDGRPEEDGLGEIGGINPPNTLENPLDAIGRRRAHAGSVGTRRARAAFHAQTTRRAIYLTSGRGLQSIDISGSIVARCSGFQGSGPGNNPPSADEIRLSPDGSRGIRQPPGQALPRPGSARGTGNGRHQNPGSCGRHASVTRQAPCRSKAATTCAGRATARR